MNRTYNFKAVEEYLITNKQEKELMNTPDENKEPTLLDAIIYLAEEKGRLKEFSTNVLKRVKSLKIKLENQQTGYTVLEKIHNRVCADKKQLMKEVKHLEMVYENDNNVLKARVLLCEKEMKKHECFDKFFKKVKIESDKSINKRLKQ